MHFEIYPPIIPNNVLTRTQITSPHFTVEPVLFGKTARRDSPIKLSVEQFEQVVHQVRKLLAAESCQVFKVDEDGTKYTVTLSMVDEAIEWMRRDAEEDDEDDDLPPQKSLPKDDEVKVEIDGQKVEVVSAAVVESGAAVEIPAPLTTPPAETPAPVETVTEAKVEETPAPAASEAPVVEEPVKKKGKGKKPQE